ncbi:MAG TPA: biosynthetic peptidoglycan transglycosylase [Longimicrobiales bacterium]|nr:biosynthetic peptidoglycan transglycosylase [Longimicrobiales bacterium]
MWKRLIVAAPLALAGAAWFYWISLPWPIRLGTHDPQSTAVMRQRIGEARARGEELEIRRDWVPLARISPRLQRAVIVAEDGRFREHGGIEWAALREEFRYTGDDEFSVFDAGDLRALVESLRYYRANRHRIRGRSTITQQVAKNLYLSTDRSAVRKLEEFVLARRLERFLTKDRILEIYLNVVEWGPGVFGAEAAARHYFSRSAADLTTDQAAALAATLPHPLTSNPRTRPGRMEWRKQMILSRMGGTGTVTTVPLEPEGAVDRPMGEAVELPPPDLPDADTSGQTAPDPGEVPPALPDTTPPHQAPDADAGAPPASAPA